MSVPRVFGASAALEIAQVRGNLWFVVLTALAAVSFLVMVSLSDGVRTVNRSFLVTVTPGA